MDLQEAHFWLVTINATEMMTQTYLYSKWFGHFLNWFTLKEKLNGESVFQKKLKATSIRFYQAMQLLFFSIKSFKSYK